MHLLSIVLPCYNELPSIDLLHKKSLYITSNYDIEIIFLDNGSSDGTSSKFKSFPKNEKIKFISLPKNKGYGYGIKKAIQSCNGKYIGWTHADLQTDLFDLIKVYDLIFQFNLNKNNAKLIIKGQRYARPIIDSTISNIMSIISLLLYFPLPAFEINAQPSIYDSEIKKFIKNAPNGYEFDIYIFILALTKGFKSVRFPVLFPKRVHGNSHWNINPLSKISFIKRTFFYMIKLLIAKSIFRNKN